MLRVMSFPWAIPVVSAAGLAAVSSVHCFAMCGPLAAASNARAGRGAMVRYLLGRLSSYAVLGLLAGAFGASLVATPWARWGEALLAWILAALLIHYALGFLGVGRRQRELQIGRGPRRSLIGRVLAQVAHDALLLGAATALLPCAALYGALAASAALHDPLQGSLFMASFALITSPVLAGGAQLSRVAQLGQAGRRVLGAVLVAGAVVTALRPIPSLRADSRPSCPLHAGGHEVR